MKSAKIIVCMVFLLSINLLVIAVSEKDYSISLMNDWKVKKDDNTKKLGDKFFRIDFNDKSWEDAEINEEEPQYSDRFVFYRRLIDIPATWQGKKVKILFSGVDDDAIVYLNEQNLGQHKGYDEPFDFDVTSVVKYGDKNMLAVLCDNSGGDKCGIYGSVSIVLVDELAKLKAQQEAKLKTEIKQKESDGRIVHETYRNNNWELFIVNANGSNPINLTKTPDKNELYPHVSPDGTKVCFVSDEGEGDSKVRNVYYMSIDGTKRVKVADNAREPCWNPDGSAIIYLKGEFDKFNYLDYATKGIFIYDLKTKKSTQHPNKSINHLYNICCSPDGKWFVATVHAGMGYNHAILAIEANGTKVFNLDIPGCRPDISPDGKRIAWGSSDWALSIGDLDLVSNPPKVINRRNVVESPSPMKIYHIDWSPDGKFVTFSRGPKKETMGFAPEIVGIKAEGWNICVADAMGLNNWMPITSDGNCNKEPEWFSAKKRK
jgi:hypothetical protein